MLTQVGFAAVLVEGFVAGEDSVVVGRAGLEQMIDNTSEFVGGGGDRFGCAEPGAHAPEVVAYSRVTLAGAVRGHAQGVRGAALDGAGVRGEDFAAGDAMIGTQAQPRGKVFRGGKLREIAADLGEECVHVDRAQTWQGGQIDAEDAMQVAAQVELRLIALGLLALATETIVTTSGGTIGIRRPSISARGTTRCRSIWRSQSITWV